MTLDVIREHTERVGAAHYDTLVEKLKLVDIYFNEGSVEQADALEDEVLKDSVYRLGPEHPFTIQCANWTAITRKRQGRDTEAIQLQVQVVNWRERYLGPYHDDTLMPFGTLCEWCGTDKAIEMLLEAEDNL